MSIDRDTFENTSEDELVDLSITDQVLGFLATNESAHSRRAKSPLKLASTMV